MKPCSGVFEQLWRVEPDQRCKSGTKGVLWQLCKY
jgi:hypothetical protein